MHILVFKNKLIMRTTVFLILCLVAVLGLASFDMSNTNDKELSALLSHKWYNLLPQRVINERANLLKQLSPGNGSNITTIHAQAIRRMHLLRGLEPHSWFIQQTAYCLHLIFSKNTSSTLHTNLPFHSKKRAFHLKLVLKRTFLTIKPR